MLKRIRMPFKSEKIKLSYYQDRRIKLSEEDKNEIKEHYGIFSQRQLASLYGVSRRTIQFIGDPQKQIENLKRREERGGSKQYYDKNKNTNCVRNWRRYKQNLYLNGELEC